MNRDTPQMSCQNCNVIQTWIHRQCYQKVEAKTIKASTTSMDTRCQRCNDIDPR